ncbi:hypothetical protein SAMN05216262_11380 [Colwellia chukchiensis]|uniref:Methyl-accepting chemotaxis protein n=1 Tax=Colwellia chukchiensis TaxID=641665 RepID=A0A1H7R4E4_9GAMM|nr:hypothetical protein [Colwellia chukchiensis]SEL55091.1 hypothetical protein SAMN05216262_11380 [Colwellia chukchiensis]
MAFSDISFKNKILLLLIGPLLGFIWLSGSTIKQHYFMNTEMAKLSQLTQLSIVYSELVHQLHIERGTTAAFIGSNGESFSQRLKKTIPSLELPNEQAHLAASLQSLAHQFKV